jgi:hypothetical protein
MKKLLVSIAFGMATIAPPVLACQFDTDCQPGSKCAKADGQLYGMCYGGLSPGNNNDRKPVRDPLDVSGKRGNTCQFDVDCGPGNQCAKPSGELYGVCASN